MALKLPDDVYYAGLPRKITSAGMLLFDRQDRLLLVNPSYKATWDIPGGVVEADEGPASSCIREVAEELGLDRRPQRLLAVDHVPPHGIMPEMLAFVFCGGCLEESEVRRIVLQPEELVEFAFVTPEQGYPLMGARLAARVRAALDARRHGTVALLESGAVICP